MSTSIPGNFTVTYGDVTSRVRSIMNDDSAQIWTDTVLQNHVRNAYTWVYNEITKMVDVSFEKVTAPGGDIQYTPTSPGQEQDLGEAGFLPADLYLPMDLQYRANVSEEWQPVARKDRLPERSTQIPERIYEWEWRSRSIWVISANQPGLLRLRYISLLPTLSVATDPILITNVTESLAHRTAFEAYARRGQIPLSQAAKGNAKEFMDQVLDHLVLNDQYIGRRGQRFGDEGQDGSRANTTTFFGS
jgi:hypothetical protein